MKKILYKLFLYCSAIALISLCSANFLLPKQYQNGSDQYFPGKHWVHKEPHSLGFDSVKLKKAVQFALDNEWPGDKDLRIEILKAFAKEPFIKIIGPTKKRGGPAGVILRNGYITASWGDTERVDMTFSVTKSYLSTIAGLAVDAGLIRDVNDLVGSYVWDGTFAGKHNGTITWEHLLNQSSDWSGELFGMQDWADRPAGAGGIDKWKRRELNVPGTVYKYNDVRVNVLAYSLLQVWRKPLPKVLKEKIMDPIGASATWRWFGYSTSWVNVDGIKVQSVSGGGHSGGGMFINTLDQARFGLLFLRNGNWNGKQLLSEKWISAVQKPSQAKSNYGYMWWLNRGKYKVSDIDESVYLAVGFGGNYIVIDNQHDLVMVFRWLEPGKMIEMIKLVLSAIN